MNEIAYSEREKKLAKRLRRLVLEERTFSLKHHLALKMVREHAATRADDESGEVFVCRILEAEFPTKESAHG